MSESPEKLPLQQKLDEAFVLLIENLIEISRRLNLEPVAYPRNVSLIKCGADWGRYHVGVSIGKGGKIIFRFDHLVEPEYALNDNGRSGLHTFETHRQCLQSLVQHRTFELVRDVYEQNESKD